MKEALINLIEDIIFPFISVGPSQWICHLEICAPLRLIWNLGMIILGKWSVSIRQLLLSNGAILLMGSSFMDSKCEFIRLASSTEIYIHPNTGLFAQHL